MKQKQTAVIIVAVILVLLLLFGSRMFYIVKPGERAVLFKTLTGELKKDNIISTGLILVAPWNTFHKYDVKEQKAEETMDVLDKNGLMLNVDITVRFNPKYERTEVEKAIIDETGAILSKNNINMTALLIRSISLPEDIRKAIESKLTREQEALAMRFINERERLEAERKQIEAEGIANYNRTISASLTDRILTQKGIDATLELAQSQNSKVIVVGAGESGLPLILGGNN